MTSANSVQSAADLLWQHWRAGTVLEALPSTVRPASRTDGYAIQSHLVIKGRGLVGWKIAATSTTGQAHIGVDGPLAGRLLAERTFRTGASLALANNRMRVAEPEFAFRVGQSLAPRAKDYVVGDVLDAMDAALPALEVPDSRFADFATVGAAQLIADNACAHEFVLGEAVFADWRQLDFAAHRVHAEVRGKAARAVERDGVGANVLGDPRVALTWLVNELSRIGVTLNAGAIVTTGTCMQPLAIEPGDQVAVDFGVLGTISASFT